MATQAEKNVFAARIFNQARKGSALNPGLPVDLANLVVAQARHETGDFSSNFFRNYNNAFGYSYSGSRYQVGPGTNADNGLPIAKYANLEDSVKEIIDWIYRRRSEGKFPADLSSIKTPEQYATLLKNTGYYGDTLANYLKGLKNFLQAIMPSPAAGSGLVLAAAAALVIYLNRKTLANVFK